uniref:Uncharacterized protein n=1 Tax=Pseudomonas aeruginosa TaxID=287 RepID=A0A7L9EAA0_PSEAI|nr:Hypothetical protein [Pseudomonas aeruginosa]
MEILVDCHCRRGSRSGLSIGPAGHHGGRSDALGRPLCGSDVHGGQRRTFVARAQADSDQRGLCSLGRNRATWKLGYRRPLARRSRISDALVWHRPHRSRHCLS